MRGSVVFLALGVAAAAGCAPGKSIVTVTVGADAAAPIGPIAKLTVTPSDSAGHKDSITVTVGASIPPAYIFSLRFDAAVKGSIHVAVVALDGAGKTIGGGAGDVAVKPSTTAQLAVTLTKVVPLPSGATLAFTTQPADTLAKTTMAPVRVSVLDGSGALVSDADAPVTLALANATGATLAGTLTVAAIAGVATFSDLSVDVAGSGYTLVASAAGVSDVTSSPFAVKSMGWVASNAGLTGGIINDLVLDPSHPATLYAATSDNGVWKSIDSGASWARAATGLPRRKSIDALAIDPVTTTTVWATASDAGVYKSSDGGSTWVQSSTLAVNSAPTAAIAVDPSHPTAVYAAQFRALARTLDGGATWTSVTTTDTYGSGPRSIAIHPTTGAVWVAQFGGGLATSAYMASTFTLADGTGANIIPGTHPYMKCVAFNPADPAQMFASGDLTTTVYISNDTGANWTAAAGAPANAPVKMAGYVGAGLVVRMYGAVPEQGIFSTPTGTNNWSYNSAGISGASAVAVDPNTQNLVYAATSIGVARSTDSFNFTGINNGLVGHGAWSLAIDPVNGAKLYVGMRDGVFRSSDSGQSWSPPTSAMPGSTNIYGIAVSSDETLALGTDIWGFTSPDFGTNWTAISYGATIKPLYSLTAAPSQAGTFWAGGGTGDAYSLGTGATAWSPAGSGLPATSRINALVVDPTNPMIVYAATSAAGVYKTSNAGALWAVSATGLGSMAIVGLAIDPLTPATLYAASADQGVFKSTDAGATWSAASTGLGSMTTSAVALAPSQPATLYVATDQGVYQSLDGGATWASYNAGLGFRDITALVVDPTHPLAVVAATWDGGVFRNVTQ
jgi:hypothetical protein